MNTIMTLATKTLNEEIGQGKVMALATRNGDGVAVRTVYLYTYDGCFYFVTETGSNKYAQIAQNNKVALSADAIQITGDAIPLEHPCHESNGEIARYIEEKLPQQFLRYKDNSNKRLIKVIPSKASFVLLKSGEGYVIDFSENSVVPIGRRM